MLELDDVSLRLGARTVLAHVSLRVAAGERIGLIGPSGAGKSSLLRLACGLARPSGGRLRNGFARPVLLFFQEPRLLPWRCVEDNLALPLVALGVPAAQARERALHWLARMELDAAVARAWPRQLSGGMAQRVALARALATEPDLLLLDEPFSALDPQLRRQMARLRLDCVARSGAALLCVSHHPEELGALVERGFEMRDGRLAPWHPPHTDSPAHAPESGARAPSVPDTP